MADPKLVDELKKFFGVAPYDGPENYARNDSYFALDLKKRYSAEQLKEAAKTLGKDWRG